MQMKTITLQKGAIKDTPEVKVEKMMQQVARPGMSFIHFVLIVIHCISRGLGIVCALQEHFPCHTFCHISQPIFSAAVPLTLLSMFLFQFPSFFLFFPTFPTMTFSGFSFGFVLR